MMGGEEEQATERRGVIFTRRAEPGDIGGREAFREGLSDPRRYDFAPAQHPPAPQDDSQSGNRGQAQQYVNGSIHK
jgi:hypothetical protein